MFRTALSKDISLYTCDPMGSDFRVITVLGVWGIRVP